jgi:protein TonB
VKNYFVFYLLFPVQVLFAQEISEAKPITPVYKDSGGLVTRKATEPSFKGDWVAFLVKHIAYPPKAFQNNIQGTVQIDFIVEKNGTVTNLVVSGNSEQKNRLLVSEAIRVLKLTGNNWLPGRVDGIPVRTLHSQNFHFTIVQ